MFSQLSLSPSFVFPALPSLLLQTLLLIHPPYSLSPFPPLFPPSLFSLSSLLFSYPLELLPPIISGNSTVNESDSLLLDCDIFNSYPLPSLAWVGPQGENPLVRERQLSFPSITRSMTGQYRCRASYDGNTEISVVNVTVQCKWREWDGQGGERQGREGIDGVLVLRRSPQVLLINVQLCQ